MDPKEQLAILKRLQTALSDEEYLGIEFINDIKSQITLMENPFEVGDDLVIQDTEDWQDLFLCGTEVVGSCQKIDGDPDYNKSLLGYVLDGKIRMIKIAGKDGSTIARSIIKVVKDVSGNPALLLERIYPDNKYEKEIKKFALKRAESLGMTLYEFDVTSLIKLESEGNTAPYEYEDAGFGINDWSFSVNVKRV